MISTETELSPPGYRPCVGIFLIGPDRRVFVGQRLDTPGAWQMPQGGIDAGETPLEAGLREMREEIGTDRAELLAESSCWRSYDLPPELARSIWGGRYRGQSQKWLAFRFLGEEAEIRLETAHPEFGAWRWTDPRMLPTLAVAFKRAVYVSVVDEFRLLWA